METILPKWLEWGREIQALSQTGLHYTTSEFDRQRYERLQGLAVEMMACYSNLSAEQLLRAFLEQKGYATPKVDVRAAVFNPEGKVLLVREKADGGWTLPGGWADVGDVPSQAAEREAWEEAGVKAHTVRLVGVYDANRVGPLELFHAFKIVFLCELSEVDAERFDMNHVNLETCDATYFAEGEIPSPLSPQRTPQRVLADAFALHRDPGRPAVFD